MKTMKHGCGIRFCQLLFRFANALLANEFRWVGIFIGMNDIETENYDRKKQNDDSGLYVKLYIISIEY